MLIDLVLLLSLMISLVTDIRNRKIPNIVTFPSVLFGFSYFIFTRGWEGFLFSGKGFIIGLGLLLIPYILGGMGAGDVKLMAAIGALKGPEFIFEAFIYIILIGGGIALSLIMKKRGISNSIKTFFFTITFLRSNLGSMVLNKDQRKSSISFPYGVPIVSGTIFTYVIGSFL